MSCGLRSEGTLWVAVDRDTLADLGHLSDTLESKGLTARPLPLETIHRLEPHLAGRVLGGLDLAVRASDRSAAAVPRAGPRRGAARGSDSDRRCRAGRGPTTGTCLGRSWVGTGRESRSASTRTRWSSRPAPGASATWSCRSPRWGLRPVKGQLLRLRGPRLLTRVIRTPEVYLVPREDGELLVGATMEEMGFDLTSTAGAVDGPAEMRLGGAARDLRPRAGRALGGPPLGGRRSSAGGGRDG